VELGDPSPDMGETFGPTPSHHPIFAGELSPGGFRPAAAYLFYICRKLHGFDLCLKA